MPHLTKNIYLIYFNHGKFIEYYNLMTKYKGSFKADFYLYLYDEYEFLTKYIKKE